MQKLVRLQTLMNEWAGCQKCPMLCHDRKNVVFGYGQYEKVPVYDQGTGRQVGFGGQIVIVGEAPGANEDEKGIPFVGKSGMLLNQYLASVSARAEVKAKLHEVNNATNYDREQALDQELRALLCQEFFFTNVIACHPPENRDPTPAEVANCKPRLVEQIYVIDPVVIIAVGRVAVESLVGRKVSITQVRGELFDVTIPGRLHSPIYPLIATLHPSYLMRRNDFNQKGGDGAKTFHDFMRAMRIVDEFNFRNHGVQQPERREDD
jgi:uracil-DNA glycosylase family 4